jgi:soluble lytic murein transglycosylase-like protein
MRSALIAVTAILLMTAGTPVRQAPVPAAPAPAAGIAVPAVDKWTEEFIRLRGTGEAGRLDQLLAAIARERPAEYARYGLGYLHGRVKLEAGQPEAALQALSAYTGAGHPLRDLALHWRAAAAQAAGRGAEASQDRETLALEYAQSPHRTTAVHELARDLAAGGDTARLAGLAARTPDAPGSALRRHLQARLAEARLQAGDEAGALADGLRLLRERHADDAAERVARALDRDPLRGRLSADDRALVGEALRAHRRFDQALVLLEAALPVLPDRRDELLFAIGRARFGAEDFAGSERTYLEGVASAADAEARAQFLYHAARAALLQGADARAESHLNRTVSALMPARPAPRARRGRAARPPARAALALVQRLRLRLGEKRLADAAADLAVLRRHFPRSESASDGALAYGVALVAQGRSRDALAALAGVRSGRDEERAAEAAYWEGRAWEPLDKSRAVAAYLRVLRSGVPTPFAAFARLRLDGPLHARAEAEAGRLEAEALRLDGAGQKDGARRALTDALLLSAAAQAAQRRSRLAALYRTLPAYQAALDLQPLAFPRLPLPEPALAPAPTAPPSPEAPWPWPRTDLLLALGLFDDAGEGLVSRYPLEPPASALARAEALHRGGSPRSAIRAAEAARRGLPGDIPLPLLPPLLRERLYPRYFHEAIREDAERYGADPRLVISIMREESRFDARARSMAAARGLLQLIITTARAVGRQLGLLEVQPEDLYDPRTVIPIGAKYLGDLQREFGGNAIKAAAAYNAGPAQVHLWARLAPGPGDDAFYSSINFDETRSYVAKVLQSYERYADVYESRRAAISR